MSVQVNVPEVPAIEVARKRNHTNRIGLYIAIGLCIALPIGNILELGDEPVSIWRTVSAFGPLAIAYVLFRQLPRYSDKNNG